MPVSFNWDFEEKEPDASHPGGITPPPGRRRRWLFSVATLLVLLAVGGLSVRVWLNNKLEAIEKIESGLRDVVELELKSIADGDVELFRLLQDPTIPRWRSQQVVHYIPNSAVDSGRASNFVPAPGLVPADRPPEIEQVRVFGLTGRVKLVYWFQPLRVNLLNPFPASWLSSVATSRAISPTTPLPFNLTWFYRLDENGAWYHTAPPDDYVGVPYSWHGTWLDIHAIEAEAELLDAVAPDLARLIFDGCQLLDCPADAHYILSFDNALSPQVYGARWRLPAPYLTGIPKDALARAVWTRAVKLWMVEGLAQSRVGAGAADRVIYRHLVTRLQAELGLIELPSPDVETLAQALSEGEGHTLQGLWEAGYDPGGSEGNRLLDAEVAALLQWLEGWGGTKGVLELLPALRRDQGFDMLLLANYRLGSLDAEARWLTYLSELTGVTALPPAVPEVSQALEPPPTPPPPQIPPGDQLAYICDDRVWVSNADGSNRVLLSASDQRFNGLHWSPDGRWLLTSWQHGRRGQSVPYLLAADGSGGRLLMDDASPEDVVLAAGWSPDGRQAVYYVYRGMVGGETETWAADVETGETRRLPGLPAWSPDGQRLVYAAGWLDFQGNAVWLADADWENVRQIADRAWIGGRGAWSPDGSQLALTLLDDDPTQNTIALYELATANITPLLTAADLTEIVSSSIQAGVVITVSDDRPLHTLWPQGWSADGRHLVVSAQAASEGANDRPPTVLAVAPLDSSAPRVLAYGESYANAVWSPTNPHQLTFARIERRPPENPVVYLFDLINGPMYTATQSWSGVWSPDGAWVAFAGQSPLIVVDQRGRARFTSSPSRSCSDVAWNPAANLNALGRTISLTLTSLQDDWGLENVRVYRDRDQQSLHGWGELVNHSGVEQHIIDLAPTAVRDGDGNPVQFEGRFMFPLSYRLLIQSTSLADGRSLPFNFVLPLPDEVWLEDGSEIVVQVAAEPAEPTRDDPDIPNTEYDLSEWPETFAVSGTWENPGPDLSEYVALVVTVYGEDGQVLGWGWREEREPAYLASGAHDFAFDITLPDVVTDLNLPVGSYKVQLFAR